MSIITFGNSSCSGNKCIGGFSGFQDPSVKYKYMIICDWDCCLFSSGVYDSITIDGSYKEPPDFVGGACTGTTQNYDPDTGECTGWSGNWNKKVDGHYVMTSQYGIYKCVDATGGYSSYKDQTFCCLDEFYYETWYSYIVSNNERRWDQIPCTGNCCQVSSCGGNASYRGEGQIVYLANEYS